MVAAAAGAAKRRRSGKSGGSSSAAAAAAADDSSSASSDSEAEGSEGSDSDAPGENLPTVWRNLRVVAVMMDDNHYKELSTVEQAPNREALDSGKMRKKHPAWRSIAKDARSTVRRSILRFLRLLHFRNRC